MDLAPLSTQLISPIPPPPGIAAVARGFSVGAVIGRTFSVWWGNLFRFGLLGLLAYVPIIAGGGAVAGIGAMAISTRSVGQGGTQGRSFVPMPGLWVLLGAIVLVSILLTVVEMGAITYGAVDAIAGRKPRIGSMLRVGLRRAGPLFLAGLLSYLLVIAGTLLLFVPGIILFCALSVTIPACVAEGKGPIESLRRSFALTRGHRLELFAAFLVVLMATGMVNMVTSLVTTLLTASLGPSRDPVAGLVSLLIAMALNAMAYTLVTVLPAVGYHDLRVAKEGVVTADLLKVFE